MICSILSLANGEEAWRDIQILFTRNLPIDNSETATMVNQLRGIVSDKTLIAQLPFITDVDAEMDAVQEQNALNASLYNFSSGSEVAEDELLER